jgi:acetyl esterase/lipase
MQGKAMLGIGLLLMQAGCAAQAEPKAAALQRSVVPPLTLASGQTPDSVDRLPSRAPVIEERYGSDSPRQIGELRLPDGKGPFPVAIVVHGGCWTKGFATEQNMAALAGWLTDNGVATWNIDYREIGDEGGGWPGTFADWAAGADHLRTLAKRYPLDLTRVSTVGHSAGATAALWLAMPDAAGGPGVKRADPIPVKAAIVIDGPLDLAPLIGMDAAVCGKPVIAPFMGGTPAEQPARYAAISIQTNPPRVERMLLVGAEVLPGPVATGIASMMKGAGMNVTGLAPAGAGHFDVIAPGTPGFAAIAEAVIATVSGR